jgi:excisionase family DNA binding protein
MQAAPTEAPVFLTAREVCDLLRISRWTLDRRIKAGQVPTPCRDGGRLLFVASEVQAHLDALPRVGPAADDIPRRHAVTDDGRSPDPELRQRII